MHGASKVKPYRIGGDQGRRTYEAQVRNFDGSPQQRVLLTEQRVGTFFGSVFESFTL